MLLNCIVLMMWMNFSFLQFYLDHFIRFSTVCPNVLSNSCCWGIREVYTKELVFGGIKKGGILRYSVVW